QGMRTPDPNYSNNIGLDGDLMPVGHAFQDETAISSPFPLLSPVQSLLFSRTQLSKLFRNVPLVGLVLFLALGDGERPERSGGRTESPNASGARWLPIRSPRQG